ncbi:MAG: ROK family protein [Ruminococcaceae bacterium]|nr:ROK family protein [Oscillospiraceae bacterium]
MYYIGVDLGGTNIAIGIVDSNMKIIEKGSVPTLSNRDGELIIRDMANLANSLIKKCGLKVSDIASVGIASPGSIDHKKGLVVCAHNLPFKNFPIVDCFKKYLPIERVFVENDANAAALAEALAGAARGTKDSVMITLGTGVGGGIIIDNKVYSGFNGAAGELGHIVIAHGGRLCSCGRRGCWEAYSSATGLVNMTKEKLAQCRSLGIKTLMEDELTLNNGKVNARIAFNAQKAGDKAGKEVIREYLSYLSCGLINIINTFQPEVLSIGGGVCNEGDNLLNPLLELIDEEQFTKDSEKKTKIKLAVLGNDAGIIGAAGLGL